MGRCEWGGGLPPREKMLLHGAAMLSDAELLALMLRTGSAGKPVMVLANELLNTFGGVAGLVSATQQDICSCVGIGEAKFVQLKAAFSLAERALLETVSGLPVLDNVAAVKLLLQSRMGHLPHESFAVLCLDSRHRLIALREMFRGTLDGASVHPREVVKQALSDNAAAMIFAHNHPSGAVEPSCADDVVTEKLVAALGLIDVRVLDHFIIGRSQVYSYRESGKLH